MSAIEPKILGWMIQGPYELNLTFRLIDAKLFEAACLPQYKEIVKAVAKYHSRYKMPPSMEILQEMFEGNVEVLLLLNDLPDEACKKNEVGHYIDLLKTRYNNFLLKKLSDSVVLPESDIDDRNALLKRMVAKIDRLHKSDTYSEGNFSDTAEERKDRYLYRKDNPEASQGVLTGYFEIDDYTYGIKKSEMMVITGASSSGKSMLLMNIGVNAWLRGNDPTKGKPEHQDGYNVVYFTLEMNKQQLEDRIDACSARIRHKALTRGDLSEEEERRFNNSLEFQKQYEPKLYIVDIPRGATVAQIEAKYEALLGEFEPDLICVDYLGIMSAEDTGDADWLEVGKVAASMHEFCRNKDAAVVTAAQRKATGRKTDDDEEGRDLEKIGRSKLIGDNANIVLMIANRKDEYLREDFEATFVKNRDGKLGTIHLRKVFDQSRIEDWPEDWSGEPGDENAV
jgi:replicative DNA helicase